MTDVHVAGRPANNLPIEMFFYDRANNTLRTQLDQVKNYGYLPHGINVFSKNKSVLFTLVSDNNHTMKHRNYVFKAKDPDIKTKVVIEL